MILQFLAISAIAFSHHAIANGNILVAKGEAILNNQTLKKSDIVKQGDIIKTGKSSLVLIKFDTGATIKVNQNSELKISIYRPKSKQTLVSLIKGSSFFKKDPKVNGKLNVKTRLATMAVRGTQFFVSYGKDLKDDVFMCVNKGSVLVSSDNKKGTIVKEGEGVNISSKRQVSRPRFLPWTKDLNWNLNPKDKNLENSASIEEKYGDPLVQDYD